MTTYKVVRQYQKGFVREIIATGLTNQAAQDHCSDPETSSTTCSTTEALERTRERGPWFDSWYEE